MLNSHQGNKTKEINPSFSAQLHVQQTIFKILLYSLSCSGNSLMSKSNRQGQLILSSKFSHLKFWIDAP